MCSSFLELIYGALLIVFLNLSHSLEMNTERSFVLATVFSVLPRRMSTHSRMAMRAPVLRPAEDRNAWALHTGARAPRWHGHTLSVSVLVLLRRGSPPSHTITGSWYSSCSAWVKPCRRANTLALLSVRKSRGLFSLAPYVRTLCNTSQTKQFGGCQWE